MRSTGGSDYTRTTQGKARLCLVMKEVYVQQWTNPHFQVNGSDVTQVYDSNQNLQLQFK